MQRRRALMMAQADSGSIIDGADLTWVQGVTDVYFGGLRETDYYISTSNYIDIQDSEYEYLGPVADINGVNYDGYIVQYDSNGIILSYLAIVGDGNRYSHKLSARCRKIKITIGRLSSTGTGVTMLPSEGSIVKIKVQSIQTPEITWLYQNGTISELVGTFRNSVGWVQASTYNKVSQESTYIKFSNNASGSGSGMNGVNSTTSSLELPNSFVGKYLYFRIYHKNSSSASGADTPQVIISDAVVSSTNRETACPDPNYGTITTRKNSSFVYYGRCFKITRGGYITLAVRRAKGIMETRYLEVWIE